MSWLLARDGGEGCEIEGLSEFSGTFMPISSSLAQDRGVREIECVTNIAQMKM
ncbi:hypothetical protein PV327_009166, partial [Microctonus hyperodae]